MALCTSSNLLKFNSTSFACMNYVVVLHQICYEIYFGLLFCTSISNFITFLDFLTFLGNIRTLSPMSSFSSELGIQFGTLLEAPHVIDIESQV